MECSAARADESLSSRLGPDDAAINKQKKLIANLQDEMEKCRVNGKFGQFGCIAVVGCVVASLFVGCSKLFELC